MPWGELSAGPEDQSVLNSAAYTQSPNDFLNLITFYKLILCFPLLLLKIKVSCPLSSLDFMQLKSDKSFTKYEEKYSYLLPVTCFFVLFPNRQNKMVISDSLLKKKVSRMSLIPMKYSKPSKSCSLLKTTISLFFARFLWEKEGYCGPFPTIRVSSPSYYY